MSQESEYRDLKKMPLVIACVLAVKRERKKARVKIKESAEKRRALPVLFLLTPDFLIFSFIVVPLPVQTAGQAEDLHTDRNRYTDAEPLPSS